MICSRSGKKWYVAEYCFHLDPGTLWLNYKQNDDQVEDLLPVLIMNEPMTCDTAMQKSYDLLKEEAAGFYDAEKRLMGSLSDKDKAVGEAFVQGCLNIAMGLAHWR